jgi:hypothetical protein
MPFYSDKSSQRSIGPGAGTHFGDSPSPDTDIDTDTDTDTDTLPKPLAPLPSSFVCLSVRPSFTRSLARSDLPAFTLARVRRPHLLPAYASSHVESPLVFCSARSHGENLLPGVPPLLSPLRAEGTARDAARV